MTVLTGAYATAAALWFLLFSPWTAPERYFWLAMAGATGFLALLAAACGHRELRGLLRWKPRYLAVGISSAAVLYGIFFVAYLVSTRLFSFPQHDIAGVYELKSQTSAYAVGAALLLWIGPAEEIFWRGLILRRAQRHWGDMRGYFAAALMYAAVHVWTFNFTLVVAAFICGLFWGWLFIRFRSLWPVIISHALWDLAVFVLFPIGA